VPSLLGIVPGKVKVQQRQLKPGGGAADERRSGAADERRSGLAEHQQRGRAEHQQRGRAVPVLNLTKSASRSDM
jgi:hypothetical protein